MQFIVLESGNVNCPACGATLDELREQVKGDRRVLIMLHPDGRCKLEQKTLRIDMVSGYGEEIQPPKEDEGC